MVVVSQEIVMKVVLTLERDDVVVVVVASGDDRGGVGDDSTGSYESMTRVLVGPVVVGQRTR